VSDPSAPAQPAATITKASPPRTSRSTVFMLHNARRPASGSWVATNATPAPEMRIHARGLKRKRPTRGSRVGREGKLGWGGAASSR
jgi:hypothetical protein